MRFSIIIPAYNAAITLARCLCSILDQTFADYQVLVVNDGSADDIASIARDYAARDPRFLLISTAHGGAGAARNRGLEKAAGEYVLYLDADDYWVDRTLLEKLHDRILRQPADVYMYQMVKVTDDGEILHRYTKPPFHIEDQALPLEQVYADLVRDGQTLASACNKCVRRELLLQRGVRFREDVFCEDIDWVLQLFSYVQTICLLNLRGYAYTQHKGESRSRHPDAPNDLVAMVDAWSRRLDGIPHVEAVAGLVAFEYGICMGSLHRLCPEKKRLLKQCAGLLRDGLDRKTKLICKFHRIFGFTLTCFAIRIYLLLRRIW